MRGSARPHMATKRKQGAGKPRRTWPPLTLPKYPTTVSPTGRSDLGVLKRSVPVACAVLHALPVCPGRKRHWPASHSQPLSPRVKGGNLGLVSFTRDGHFSPRPVELESQAKGSYSPPPRAGENPILTQAAGSIVTFVPDPAVADIRGLGVALAKECILLRSPTALCCGSHVSIHGQVNFSTEPFSPVRKQGLVGRGGKPSGGRHRGGSHDLAALQRVAGGQPGRLAWMLVALDAQTRSVAAIVIVAIQSSQRSHTVWGSLALRHLQGAALAPRCRRGGPPRVPERARAGLLPHIDAHRLQRVSHLQGRVFNARLSLRGLCQVSAAAAHRDRVESRET